MVVGWLSRIVLILGIVGVAGYDGVTTIQAQVTIKDQASSAAIAGYNSYASSHDVQTAYQAALADARGSNPANTIAPAQFTVSNKGIVTLTVTRNVHTLVAHYLPIDAAKTATSTAVGDPLPNP
jgi:Flp pilus assembly protein TadG